MSSNQNLIVPTFKMHVTQNEVATRAKGRPIFDEMEVVEIRMAGNKETVAVYPAHDVWKIVDKNGAREPETYAMRWPDLYQRFKANKAQVQSGTPLSEAPFLTQAKRLELKALNIHTVEALAAIDGQPLNMLGMGGREMKQQAEAYLQKASDSALETRLAAENVDLKQQIADLQAQFAELNNRGAKTRRAKKVEEVADEPGADEGDTGVADDAVDEADEDNQAGADVSASPFDSWEDDDIKLWIAEETGSRPKGNPNHATLVRMADEVNEELSKQAKAQGE